MNNFLLGLVLGLVAGFVGGLYYFAKRIYKTNVGENITRDAINALVTENPKGDFISVNPVEQYVRDRDGEIKLADVLEDDRQ